MRAHADKAERSLGKFAKVWSKRKLASEAAGISVAPERAPIFMTESAVSNHASDAAEYITETLDMIEKIGEVDTTNLVRVRKKLRKCKNRNTSKKIRKCKKKFKRKLNEAVTDQYLDMKGWSWHSLFEAFVWDCRRATTADSSSVIGYSTDRCQALKDAFSR